MNTAQIGASGVLLIQYRLLKLGIDSAQMTTDDGIDLVVYSPKRNEALTVQVKTCLKPKPAGGKGAMTYDWWLRASSPAQLVGLVDLQTDSAWLFRHHEFEAAAQQKQEATLLRTKPKLHFYLYIDEARKAKLGSNLRDFEDFRIEKRAPELFA